MHIPMYLKHEEGIEDYRPIMPFEPDKTKSIANMTTAELVKMRNRLDLELQVEGNIRHLRRNSSGKSYEGPEDEAPIDTLTPVGELYHYGVKGQRWGYRKDEPSSGSRKKKAPTPASEDYKRAQQLKARSKKGSKSLTTQELKELTNRMQLEQQYSKLKTDSSKSTKALNFVKTVTAVGTTVAAL